MIDEATKKREASAIEKMHKEIGLSDTESKVACAIAEDLFRHANDSASIMLATGAIELRRGWLVISASLATALKAVHALAPMHDAAWKQADEEGKP